jgi:hypothetical protein
MTPDKTQAVTGKKPVDEERELSPQIRLEQAAYRIQRGRGTHEDEQLIRQKFDEVRETNLRALRRNMRWK